MGYTIRIERKAAKALAKIDTRHRRRIEDQIADLAETPRPDGCKKLTGIDGYRIRIGDYRVIYTINDRVLTVTVVKIGTRQSMYKKG